jgi:hypothetical protein
MDNSCLVWSSVQELFFDERYIPTTQESKPEFSYKLADAYALEQVKRPIRILYERDQGRLSTDGHT